MASHLGHGCRNGSARLPRLIVTAQAARGIGRCRRALQEKNARASLRASQAIAHHLTLLETNPDIGRPYSPQPEFRELVISFGDSGYVALYRHEPTEDSVYVLAFRHQREAGY